MVSLLILRNDLRLHDHEGFTIASQSSQLIILYVFDPSLLLINEHGFERIGQHRLRFLKESLVDLDQSLRKMDQKLNLMIEDPVKALQYVLNSVKVDHVIWQEEDTTEEQLVEDGWKKICEKFQIKFSTYRGQCLFDRETISELFKTIPHVFTEFRKKVEKYCTPLITSTFPKSLPPYLDLKGSINPSEWELNMPYEKSVRFKGGEQAGLNRLKSYIWEKDLIKIYKLTRNEMLGDDYSSKFSPWLSLGCLSPRLICQEIKKYENERLSNESTYWLFFELIWREFFRVTAAEQGIKMFRHNGLNNKKLYIRPIQHLVTAWMQAETGIPVIDACMKELSETGFMSNRGRQLTASFFVKDLLQQWWIGAEWFEHHLVDYDPCSNYGNWLYVAGLGNDPREDRYFNQILQAERYDPHAKFVKHWLPEYKNIPRELIHRPHLWKKKGISFSKQPILDTAKWEQNPR